MSPWLAGLFSLALRSLLRFHRFDFLQDVCFFFGSVKTVLSLCSKTSFVAFLRVEYRPPPKSFRSFMSYPLTTIHRNLPSLQLILIVCSNYLVFRLPPPVPLLTSSPLSLPVVTHKIDDFPPQLSPSLAPLDFPCFTGLL